MVAQHFAEGIMSDTAQSIETLSKREAEVANAYADGASYKVIARDLGISPTTVRSHLRTVYGKLNVTSKIALAQALADPDAQSAEHQNAADLTADLALELDEAMRRERTMTRVLRIIKESSGNLDEVIDEVLEQALEICEAEFGILMAHHGDFTFTEMRSSHISAPFAAWLSEQGLFNPGSDTAVGRAARSLKPVSIADVNAEDVAYEDNPLRFATLKFGQARSLAAIPMTAGGRLIGVFSVYRTRVHPFNDRALELAQAFADQAAIAIENSAHINEMEARLERSSATREILDAISASSDDEGPVFDAILRNAAKLCDAPMARLELADAARQTHYCAAAWGDAMRSFKVGEALPLDQPNDLPTAIREGVVRHIHDLSKSELYLSGNPTRVRMVEEEGYRTYLCVPLIASGVSIGAIVLSRREVAPFSDESIRLVENLAIQAVIAIENVRRFRALRDRLERAAATREVLEAISAASDDERPVFDAILGNARKLCDAPFAALILGRETDDHQTMIAHHGALQSTEELYSQGQVPMDPNKSFAARAIIEKRPVHLHNMMETEQYRAGVPNVVELCDVQGIRTNLFVPLIRDGIGIGCFIIFRHEVRPYTDEQIALVETFATQAVIALDNVRQFRDLRQRLEREAATREILQVINQNRKDARPVFDAILKNAIDLCGASAGALTLGAKGDTHQRMAVSQGVSQATLDVYERGEVSMNPDISMAAKAILSGDVVHVADMADTDGYRAGVSHYTSVVDDTGIRTNLFVPLMTPEGGEGVLVLFRKEVKPYTPDEIALVETFAAQAAIALENVRQFRAVETRLEREKASSDILTMISQSRDNEAPVFELILRRAADLCNAHAAALAMGQAGDTHQTMEASYGLDPATIKVYDEGRVPMDPTLSVGAQAILTQKTIHVPDMAETDAYKKGVSVFVSVVEENGTRTNLLVPLVTSEGAIGVLILFRKEVKPYTDDEIALVETFAAQAVIAIENARQFRDLQARTSEVQGLNASLEAKVDAQVVEIERMGRLKRFLPAAVADTVVSSGSEKMLQSHRALLGVLFCDIRGFTAFCETAEPEETIEVLQTYHEEMGKLINEHGAGVDLRMGDGVMVLFNDPVPCDDPAGDAVRLAIAMRARMAELCTGWKRLGHRLGFGVGVSLGYATVGLVGFAGRFDYTASGTAINLASRLCDEAVDGEILLSTRAGIAVEDSFEVETRGELSLKGIREPIEVFRLSGEI
ncbi:GAF domain-containing protein [uncultured Tateyamaria sp.]|uniref:GAF domain-containing protein n=1 Tax=uncultured Tateyamaria sp. TaxID=455651 RepID=UPI0026018BD7|nr:GAF domain-containing protein [uncultured Tateyamaria sp.]